MKVIVPGKRNLDVSGRGKGGAATSIVVSTSRGPEAGFETVDVDRDKHVVEVEFEGGLTLLKQVETIPGVRKDERLGRGEEDTWVLPTHFEGRKSISRGVGSILVKSYRFLTGESLIEDSAKVIAKRLEEKTVDGKDALCWVGKDGIIYRDEADHQKKIDALDLPSGSTMFVMIHGTFSSGPGSFAPWLARSNDDGMSEDWRGSIAQQQWKTIYEKFTPSNGTKSANVFAFEHRTVTVSPIENAINLLRALPERAQLHLMTQSRGGLVGEIIALFAEEGMATIEAETLQIKTEGIRDQGSQKEKEDIKTLRKLIAEKQPVVRNFVRVAAPMRGTQFLSDKLDLILSAIANLMRMVPGAFADVIEEVWNFARAVVAERRDAEVLPGLAAMDPTSFVVALLNSNPFPIKSKLTVLGGDLEGRNLFSKLALLTTDYFHTGPNDLVVDNWSMICGVKRSSNAMRYIHAATDIHHLCYWANKETSQIIVDLVVGKESDLPEPIAPVFASPAIMRSSDEGKPLVYLLPGIMGSHLKVEAGDTTIWLDPVKMALGGISDINAKADGIVADGYIKRYYQDLHNRLSRTHRVISFPFDWRMSFHTAAQRLAEDIRVRSDNGAKSVQIVAHSLGGLVARQFIADQRALWKRVRNNQLGVGLVMLGTPNGGSMSILWNLLGHDDLIQKLARIDRRHDLPQVIDFVRAMPGVLELLPRDKNGFYFDRSNWEDFKGVAVNQDIKWPIQSLLWEAKGTTDTLAQSFSEKDDPDQMAYIAGQAELTPAAIQVNPFKLLASPDGDGRVLWRSGILPTVPTWYAQGVAHGDLARDRNVLSAVVDLLQNKITRALPERPQSTRSPEHLIEIDPGDVLYPALEEIEAAAVGALAPSIAGKKTITPRCHVSIKHGDLRLHSRPLAVGHYAKAPLINAEQALDESLDGRLQLHRELGLYPEEIGQSEFYTRQGGGAGPAGALVIGLGAYGQLSPRRLTTTLTQAFLRFGMQSGPRAKEQPKTLSSLLIGHRDSLISIRDCITAILEALQNTNNRLPPTHCIGKLCLLEFYEDTAINAAETLREFSSQERWQVGFDIESSVQIGLAGRSRHSFDETGSWQQVIQITKSTEDQSELMFEGINRSAQVDGYKKPINRSILDEVILDAVASTSAKHDVGKKIFQWMVPRALQDRMSDGRDLVLILDPVAAQYPWELMDDPFSKHGKPVAIRGGLIRQLKDDTQTDKPMVASNERVLLVGDPESEFNELKNAQEEVDKLGAEFEKHGWGRQNIEIHVGKGIDVAGKLTLQENRIFHFAGHGVEDYTPPDGSEPRSGLVIGHGKILEPSIVNNMSFAPQFVFLNCCHVGEIRKTGNDLPLSGQHNRTKIAANLAIEFIRLGTKAVIAAGWAVDDAQAKLFAETFYAKFLAGESFGAAVEEARRELYETNHNLDTWAAYQCYGDSQFRLRRTHVSDRRSSGKNTFVSPAQATTALRSISLEARFARSINSAKDTWENFQKVKMEIESHNRWSSDPTLFEALGEVSQEMGDYVAAIRYFERAVRRSPPGLSVNALENLRQLQIRQRIQEREKKEAQGAAVDKALADERHLISRVIDDLRNSEEIAGSGGSSIRQSRLGDSYLRLAAAHTGKGKRISAKYRECLELAGAAYQNAEYYASNPQGIEICHAIVRNVLSGHLLGLMNEEKGSPSSGAQLGRAILQLGAESDESSTFERRRLKLEASIFSSLFESGPTTHDANMLTEDYGKLFLDGASIGQRKEVVDDLKTLCRLLHPKAPVASTMIRQVAQTLTLSIPVFKDQG